MSPVKRKYLSKEVSQVAVANKSREQGVRKIKAVLSGAGGGGLGKGGCGSSVI